MNLYSWTELFEHRRYEQSALHVTGIQVPSQGGASIFIVTFAFNSTALGLCYAP
jgi:hypothetical protein